MTVSGEGDVVLVVSDTTSWRGRVGIVETVYPSMIIGEGSVDVGFCVYDQSGIHRHKVTFGFSELRKLKKGDVLRIEECWIPQKVGEWDTIVDLDPRDDQRPLYLDKLKWIDCSQTRLALAEMPIVVEKEEPSVQSVPTPETGDSWDDPIVRARYCGFDVFGADQIVKVVRGLKETLGWTAAWDAPDVRAAYLGFGSVEEMERALRREG